ncbi:MAG: VanW family protein [bacterium]
MFWFKSKKEIIIKWLIGILAVFFIFSICVCVSYIYFETKYQEKIYPGVFAGNINLGGKTTEEALNILNQKADVLNQNGIAFKYDYFQSVLLPVFSSAESDLAYQIINFEIENTVNNSIDVGRSGNLWNDLKEKTKLFFVKKQINVVYRMNEEETKKFLDNIFSKFNTPPQDATLISPASGKYEVQDEVFGQVLNYEDGLNKLKKQLSDLDNSAIQLVAEIKQPQIYKKDCINIEQKALKALDSAPLILKYNDLKWTIDKKLLSNWLTLKLNDKNNDDRVMVGIDNEKGKIYLEKVIAPQIDKEPQDAKFEIKDGKVLEFQASRDGEKINIEETLQKIESTVIDEVQDNNEIELATQILKSNINMNSVNDLGIEEIIGTGHSDFSGSPQNRRQNIKVGSDTLNGIIIKPGEEFSLLHALGEINRETGYLSELVIKGNKTVPEFGGGLCQVGTTIFRSAIASGLPITMRQNHSYRVSYYEPAGTDATIYDPWPDMKFLNDTPYHILIQSRIEGNDLYYDFWSTKDGRTSTSTAPVIYNIKSPGPTKLIETLDLEPGIKKCTERAHNGADAYFDYIVTYSPNNPPADSNGADDLTREKRFSSHYVPWREVCLIGVEELSSTSTEIIAN